ncbi:phosphomevalonate kinase [Orbilia ellipsospora]|uniref:phosphomevalonate kinase n=1 Tax=Orbilia ellipsospora TaxID=2528407 RepID=A0AAV9XR19_9PEZI
MDDSEIGEFAYDYVELARGAKPADELDDIPHGHDSEYYFPEGEPSYQRASTKPTTMGDNTPSISISPVATAVSAPGKVLLAGGYTVLDASCRGLVFALSARIHSVACPTTSSNDKDGKIIVRSPQFANAVWEYQTAILEDGKGVDVVQTNNNDPNPFILTTLKYALSYLSLPSIPSTTITILASNSYYSQPPPPIPRFNSLSVPINKANKTGLGSSAALVTSLTACLLHHFQHQNKAVESYVIHNLSQTSHSAAQGKVGSGFDVAAATYGSHEYQRFSPSLLSSLPEPNTPSFTTALQSLATKKWEMEVHKVTLPPGIGLVMGDVQCGSSTPGMVKKVLSWRKDAGEAGDELWKRLDGRNRALIQKFNTFNDGGKVNDLREKIADIRESVRELGKNAGVEIEPESQTRLIDGVVGGVEGVIGGVVPGAGGYDAVCFLYDDSVKGGREKLEKFLEGYKLDDEGGFVKVLEAGLEGEGVRKEEVGEYADVKHYFDGILDI